MQEKRNYHGLSRAGVFYRDRDEWMRYVTAQGDLDASARLVGCYIALRINPQQRETWPKQATIAKDMGVSVPTIKRAIKQLERAGLLMVEQPGRRGMKRAVNRYSLIHPADQSVTHDP